MARPRKAVPHKTGPRKPRANKPQAVDNMADTAVNGLNGITDVAHGPIEEVGSAEKPPFSWL